MTEQHGYGFDSDRWYWDKRTKKAYLPCRTDDETITFVTVWHRGEVEDAIETDCLIPLEETGFERADRTFGLKDSFRLPSPAEVQQCFNEQTSGEST